MHGNGRERWDDSASSFSAAVLTMVQREGCAYGMGSSFAKLNYGDITTRRTQEEVFVCKAPPFWSCRLGLYRMI